MINTAVSRELIKNINKMLVIADDEDSDLLNAIKQKHIRNNTNFDIIDPSKIELGKVKAFTQLVLKNHFLKKHKEKEKKERLEFDDKYAPKFILEDVCESKNPFYYSDCNCKYCKEQNAYDLFEMDYKFKYSNEIFDADRFLRSLVEKCSFNKETTSALISRYRYKENTHKWSLQLYEAMGEVIKIEVIEQFEKQNPNIKEIINNKFNSYETSK